MYITPINSFEYNNKNINPNFTGITHLMRRQIFIDGKKDVIEVLKKRGDKNTRVGQLPGFIFERLKKLEASSSLPAKEFRTQAINEIMTTFEECAILIRDFKPGALAPIDEAKNRRPKEVVEKLRAVFEKYKLIDEPEKFDLKFLGQGEYKKAFKLDGVQNKNNSETMCFKVFHLVDKTPEWHKYKCHGNFSEINIAMYWKKNVGMYTQRNKFYFGDINHGYLVDRYIEPPIEAPKKLIVEYDNGVKIVDEVKGDTGHNKIAGYSIDEGGSRVVNRIKNQSSTARYVLKKIKRTPEDKRLAEWYRILQNDKHLDNIQKKAGLALSLKHMPKSTQEDLINKCLDFNEPLVDQAIAYALKYLPTERGFKYFKQLITRKDPITQTVLLNEMPLLSRKKILGVRFDDINTPKFEVDPEQVYKYYKEAKKMVIPEVEEHLASYVHLLPKEHFSEEVDYLVRNGNYDTLDRLLHKVKFVTEEEGYSYGDKMEVINKVKKSTNDSFIQKKAEDIRIKLIRDSLGDD